MQFSYKRKKLERKYPGRLKALPHFPSSNLLLKNEIFLRFGLNPFFLI